MADIIRNSVGNDSALTSTQGDLCQYFWVREATQLRGPPVAISQVSSCPGAHVWLRSCSGRGAGGMVQRVPARPLSADPRHVDPPESDPRHQLLERLIENYPWVPTHRPYFTHPWQKQYSVKLVSDPIVDLAVSLNPAWLQQPGSLTMAQINMYDPSCPTFLRHRDSRNSTRSRLRVWGSFKGGVLSIEEGGPRDPPRKITDLSRWHEFDGKHFHSMSEVTAGTRFSIVLYCKEVPTDSPPQHLKHDCDHHACHVERGGWVRGRGHSGAPVLRSSLVKAFPSSLAVVVAQGVTAALTL